MVRAANKTRWDSSLDRGDSHLLENVLLDEPDPGRVLESGYPEGLWFTVTTKYARVQQKTFGEWRSLVACVRAGPRAYTRGAEIPAKSEERRASETDWWLVKQRGTVRPWLCSKPYGSSLRKESSVLRWSASGQVARWQPAVQATTSYLVSSPSRSRPIHPSIHPSVGCWAAVGAETERVDPRGTDRTGWERVSRLIAPN